MLAFWEAMTKAMTNLDSILKSRYYFADKGLYSQSYGFSSSHVWMWELDHKESWVLKNWCFWTVLEFSVGEDTRVPWTARRSNQSILKEISPEYSLDGLMLNQNLQYLATGCEELTHCKRPWWWESWRQEKRMTKDEMVGWHHRLNAHESEQAPGDGQESLACCSP